MTKVAGMGAAAALSAMVAVWSSGSAFADTLVVAGGCFWCVEADFERVPGVREVVSGYTGGDATDPSYAEVSAGGSGHFEAVRIDYDPLQVSLDRLLYLFLRSINPTDGGGQFCDRGDQYRTAIFVATPGERAAAEAAIAEAQTHVRRRIATEVRDLGPFYEADAYHQDFHRSADLILTRFGPKRKAEAYRLYRLDCGRDRRVLEIWGDAAPFAGK